MTAARRLAPIACLAALGCGLSRPALAHEMEPALLDIEEVASETRASLSWGDVGAGVPPRVEAPEGCPVLAESHQPNAYTGRFACDAEVFIDGVRLVLTPTTPDALVRIHRADGIDAFAVDRRDTRLRNAASEPARSFVRLGLEHILGGPDHLLFVLGLLLVLLPPHALPPVRRLVLAVTSFTVAHSVTLALSVLGAVRLPAGGVEAAIAASLVLLGLEALHPRDTWTRRAPHGVAFAFGLLHGFGFAGALRDIGLPPDGVGRALFAFNVGVELGQLAFLAISLGALSVLRLYAPRLPWASIGAYVVGTMGTVWLFERTIAIALGVST